VFVIVRHFQCYGHLDDKTVSSIINFFDKTKCDKLESLTLSDTSNVDLMTVFTLIKTFDKA
jgi:hypothetical protein